jgi:hypothetical protein
MCAPSSHIPRGRGSSGGLPPIRPTIAEAAACKWHLQPNRGVRRWAVYAAEIPPSCYLLLQGLASPHAPGSPWFALIRQGATHIQEVCFAVCRVPGGARRRGLGVLATRGSPRKGNGRQGGHRCGNHQNDKLATRHDTNPRIEARFDGAGQLSVRVEVCGGISGHVVIAGSPRSRLGGMRTNRARRMSNLDDARAGPFLSQHSDSPESGSDV